MALDTETQETRDSWLMRLSTWIHSFMPPYHETDENWQSAKPIPATRRHYVSAAGAMALVIAVTWLCWQVEFMRYSVVSWLRLLLDLTPLDPHVSDLVFSLLVGLIFAWMYFSLKKSGKGGGIDSGIGAAAIDEEMMYRVSAENWNWRERLASNAVFGTIHLFNLVVPLALVVGLGFGGWWFMRVYLHEFKNSASRCRSLQESGAVHAAYNRIAIYVVLPGSIIVSIIYSIMTRH